MIISQSIILSVVSFDREVGEWLESEIQHLKLSNAFALHRFFLENSGLKKVEEDSCVKYSFENIDRDTLRLLWCFIEKSKLDFNPYKNGETFRRDKTKNKTISIKRCIERVVSNHDIRIKIDYYAVCNINNII